MPADVVFPEAVKQQGNTSILLVPTIANPAAPTMAELDAATSINMSCYLYTGGRVTSTQNRGAAPRRLCTTQELQQFGTRTTEVTDMQYVYDPQGDDDDPANVAYTALEPGTEWFMVQRRGLSAEEDPYAPTQKLKVTRIRVGEQNDGETGEGEFDEFAVLQSVIALSPPVRAVVAGP